MRARLLVAALPLAASLTVIAAPVAALGGCTQLNGAQYTSGTCTNTADGRKFMHAEQWCWHSYHDVEVQRGRSVAVGSYSSAGPCLSQVISNRRLVQTTFP